MSSGAGSNASGGHRIYEKDYVIEFHKGYICTKEQYEEGMKYLEAHDFDAVEEFLKRNFDDAEIVKSILDNQRMLKRAGHYGTK